MKSEILKYIPVNLANFVVSFGAVTILTRILSDNEYGRYVLVIAILNFVHMGLFTWLEAAMSRFHERASVDDNLSTHFKSLYTFAFGLILVIVPLSLILIYVLPMDDRLTMLLTFGMVGTSIQLFHGITMEGHKAAHRIGRYSGVYSTEIILKFILGVIIIMMTPIQELGPFIGIVIAASIAVLIELPGMLKRSKGGRFDKKLIREYFNYGGPICFSLILGYALVNGDLFFIRYFINDAAVGGYGAGYSFANTFLSYIFVWLSMAVMPTAISSLERQGKETATQVLLDYGNILIVVTMPVAVGIALVSKDIGFIMGEPVRETAVMIMPWIAIAALLNGFINLYIYQAYVLAKKLNILAILMVPPVLMNCALNIWLIPIHGLYGAVISTLCAYTLGVILCIIGAKRVFVLPLPLIAFLKTSLSCAAMTLIVLSLNLPEAWPDIVTLAIKAGSGAIVYVVMTYLLNPANIRQWVTSKT